MFPKFTGNALPQLLNPIPQYVNPTPAGVSRSSGRTPFAEPL